MKKKRILLSNLWLFAILNYLYCDIVGLMDSHLLQQFLRGEVGGMVISQGFLLGASFLMELPIAMVLLSRILPFQWNKWMNVFAGLLMTSVQVSTLLMGSFTTYYLFFSVIEISVTCSITYLAMTWKNPVSVLQRQNLLANPVLSGK
jgi:hypothetical protein